MTQQHFATPTPTTPNADMRPCSPPLAFWTFLVCKCRDLGKRECWWRAPPLLLRDHPLQRSGSSFVARNLWSQGSFFFMQSSLPTFPTPPPINWVHPADIHIAASDGHIRHGVKLFFLRVFTRLNDVDGVFKYATKQVTFWWSKNLQIDLNNSLIANDWHGV